MIEDEITDQEILETMVRMEQAQKPSEFWAGKASALHVLTEEIKLRKKLVAALTALLEAVKAEPAMNMPGKYVGLGIQVNDALNAASIAPRAWECLGRKQTLPEPGECNWPNCGCDEQATQVITSLLEQGWTNVPLQVEKAKDALASFFSLLRQSSDIIPNAYRLDINKGDYEAARKTYESLR